MRSIKNERRSIVSSPFNGSLYVGCLTRIEMYIWWTSKKLDPKFRVKLQLRDKKALKCDSIFLKNTPNLRCIVIQLNL
jgi:hypothetical protein